MAGRLVGWKIRKKEKRKEKVLKEEKARSCKEEKL